MAFAGDIAGDITSGDVELGAYGAGGVGAGAGGGGGAAVVATEDISRARLDSVASERMSSSGRQGLLRRDTDASSLGEIRVARGPRRYESSLWLGEIMADLTSRQKYAVYAACTTLVLVVGIGAAIAAAQSGGGGGGGGDGDDVGDGSDGGGGESETPLPPIILEPTVILVSLDGFRADYLDTYSAPTLRGIQDRGVSAVMTPSFPSKTFPNHYSLVTGLYPESHGIVANTMYDPVFDATFTLSNGEGNKGRWWGGEPLWVTAEQQNVRSACMFWPGSSAEIKGTRPSLWVAYDETMPYSSRAQQVVEWLERPARERPQFVTLYFEEPDHTGHEYGPDDSHVADAVARVDAAVGDLLSTLERRGLAEQVNVLVVADHGMAATAADRVIYLDEIIDMARVDVIDWSPVFAAFPTDPEDLDALVAELQTVEHMTCGRKEDLPARFHYHRHRRIPPLVCVADEGWATTTRDYPFRAGGSHGYDNELASMQALFVAQGPAFRRGYARAERVANVHLYELMAHILGVDAAVNNGTLAEVEDFLV